MVDEVVSFEDDEEGSCINALEKIKVMHKGKKYFFVMEEAGIKKIFLK